MKSLVYVSLLLLIPFATVHVGAQPLSNLIPATSKPEFTRQSLSTAGQRPDPFLKIEPIKIVPIKTLPPPPKVDPSLLIPKGPTTPVALSVVLKGFIATADETVALVSRAGSNDIARVGDTILAAQVVAISPSNRTITLKENGQYVTRSLEVNQ